MALRVAESLRPIASSRSVSAQPDATPVAPRFSRWQMNHARGLSHPAPAQVITTAQAVAPVVAPEPFRAVGRPRLSIQFLKLPAMRVVSWFFEKLRSRITEGVQVTGAPFVQ